MEKTDEALSKILTALADKFGTTVNHLYSIMIRQAYIEGFESLLMLLIAIIISIVFYRCLKSDYKKQSKSWCESWPDYFEENTGTSVITILVAIICIVAVIAGIVNGINCFFNPEYYALHQILKGSCN